MRVVPWSDLSAQEPESVRLVSMLLVDADHGSRPRANVTSSPLLMRTDDVVLGHVATNSGLVLRDFDCVRYRTFQSWFLRQSAELPSPSRSNGTQSSCFPVPSIELISGCARHSTPRQHDLGGTHGLRPEVGRRAKLSGRGLARDFGRFLHIPSLFVSDMHRYSPYLEVVDCASIGIGPPFATAGRVARSDSVEVLRVVRKDRCEGSSPCPPH